MVSCPLPLAQRTKSGAGATSRADLQRRAAGLEALMQHAVHASCRQYKHGHGRARMVLTAEALVAEFDFELKRKVSQSAG